MGEILSHNNRHTIALIVFPLGPVTLTQAPHCAPESHRAFDSAVPNVSDGKLYPVNRQFPPSRFPP